MLSQAWKSFRAHNYELAYQECKKVEESCGQSAEYHHLMAIILWRIQEPLLAQNHFDVSLFLQPKNADCMCDYAEFLLGQDESVKAQQWIRRCIQNGTKKEQAFLLMGKCHIALNELPQARDDLKKCLQLHPTSRLARRQIIKLEKRMARLGNLKNLTVDELCQRVQELETSYEKLNQKESQSRCVVCLLKERNQVNVLCGHCSVCEECSKSVSTCPLCRKRAKFIRMFM